MAEKKIRNENSYHNALADIMVQSKLKNGAGAMHNSLAEQGLSGSGYAAHIKAEADRGLEAKRQSAYIDYMSNEAQARREYEAELDDYQRLQEEESNRIIKYFREHNIFTAEAALDVIRKSSLNQENAMDVLTRGIASAREMAIEDITKIAVGRYYNFTEARRFALAMGLLPEDAGIVAQRAFSYGYDQYNLDKMSGVDDYLGYLQKRLMSLKYATGDL
ncbi:MAG: hypothetical protein IJF38_04935 [Clostridia bacterium]|nr:hypothetical protein [Clostridia bacterium]